ncbi:sulfite exporter TauE/SafE family protein [Sphingobium sp.]|uniref:sulfite exporter TauE/SafE family protein n=1 Tax=Sphingobium sp. TaxID=1912891 RepID=UPI0028BD90B1|nr:sulfite exporter TauE/SafE family protein [Sphingobium sp.]
MTLPDPLYLICAILAVTISGLGKGGFAGLGMLSMPIMAQGVNPIRGAAILLPILVVQDIVGVWAFRRTWDRAILAAMMPGMAMGVLLGYALAAMVDERIVTGIIGLLSLLFGLYRLWLERGGKVPLRSNSPYWVGTLFGMGSGFASQIAHAGAPPFQMWVIPRQLPRDVLVGTTAIAFAAMNWMKIPTYAALGQFTQANLQASALLLPVALAATAAGVVLVRKVDAQRFYTLIYILMVVLGFRLVVQMA